MSNYLQEGSTDEQYSTHPAYVDEPKEDEDMSKESHAEQITRVEMMAEGQDTWDLSENDTSALSAVLMDRAMLLRACKALQMEATARNCGLRIADEAISRAEGAING